MSDALKFPMPPKAAAVGCTRLQRICGRVREIIGGVMHKARMPGAIRPVEFTDELTGRHIRVTTGALFTRVSVDGRDYYFKRLGGRYDGSGMGCG